MKNLANRTGLLLAALLIPLSAWSVNVEGSGDFETEKPAADAPLTLSQDNLPGSDLNMNAGAELDGLMSEQLPAVSASDSAQQEPEPGQNQLDSRALSRIAAILRSTGERGLVRQEDDKAYGAMEHSVSLSQADARGPELLQVSILPLGRTNGGTVEATVDLTQMVVVQTKIARGDMLVEMSAAEAAQFLNQEVGDWLRSLDRKRTRRAQSGSVPKSIRKPSLPEKPESISFDGPAPRGVAQGSPAEGSKPVQLTYKLVYDIAGGINRADVVKGLSLDQKKSLIPQLRYHLKRMKNGQARKARLKYVKKGLDRMVKMKVDTREVADRNLEAEMKFFDQMNEVEIEEFTLAIKVLKKALADESGSKTDDAAGPAANLMDLIKKIMSEGRVISSIELEARLRRVDKSYSSLEILAAVGALQSQDLIVVHGSMLSVEEFKRAYIAATPRLFQK